MEDKWRDKYISPPEKHEIVPQSKSIPASGQSPGVNKFANDGSFMAMFRKKMTESQTKTSDSAGDSNADDVVTASLSAQTPSSSGTENSAAAPDSAAAVPTKPSVTSFVGKRRGGKVLKTGAVKKVKKDEEENAGTKDAWAQYLDEVKKYKSQLCGDEDKTRPLVK